MVINIMSYGKVIQSPKHHGNQNQHSLPMVTHWHSINSDINFHETHYNRNELPRCNNVDIFDDIYFELNLIRLAITMDEISSLLEQEPAPPPHIFDPFQTIRKYC